MSVIDATLSDSNSAAEIGAAEFSNLQIFLVILALACGGFGIGTGEFAIMGFLPDVGLSFGVSTPVAGYVIAAGFGYTATGYVGAALSAIGLVVFAVSLMLERRLRFA